MVAKQKEPVDWLAGVVCLWLLQELNDLTELILDETNTILSSIAK